MDLTQDHSDSPAECPKQKLESPQSTLSEQLPEIYLDQSIDVNAQPVQDIEPNSVTRTIHPSCGEKNGIGITYHLDTADVNFAFDFGGNDEVVPAHKCILAFHSPVFRQMFYGELKEKGDIKLPDTTVDAFVDLMKCMYGLQLTIEGSQSKIEPLLGLVHKYDVNWVEKECQRILIEIINGNAIAILWVLPLANLYSYDELRQKCIDTIHAHGKSIIESAELIDCEMKIMKEIFGIDFVDRNEVKVFEMYIKWAKIACEKAGLDLKLPENIRQRIGNCFDLIRFDSMTQEQFLKCLSINSVVLTPQEIEQYATKLTQSIPQNEHREPSNDAALKPFNIVSPFNTAQSSLQQLLEDQSTADVTFVFKNDTNEETERIPAHKCILASESEVFANRLKDETQSTDEIIITGVSAEAFMYFLRLVYVKYGVQLFAILKEVGEQHFDALLSLNGVYETEHAPFFNDVYTEYLTITLNKRNVIQRFELSRKYSLDELKKKCVDLMKEKSKKLITSNAFMECSPENLKTILEMRIWGGEKSMAAACIKWAKKYCTENQLDPTNSKNLRTVFGDTFEVIPFSKMVPRDFLNFQYNHKGLLTAEEVFKVLNGIGIRSVS